jgi:hypothetical protein
MTGDQIFLLLLGPTIALIAGLSIYGLGAYGPGAREPVRESVDKTPESRRTPK